MAKDRIPTSRIARTARVSGLAAGPGGPTTWARGRRTSALETEGSRAALERRNLEAAEQIVAGAGDDEGPRR